MKKGGPLSAGNQPGISGTNKIHIPGTVNNNQQNDEIKGISISHTA